MSPVHQLQRFDLPLDVEAFLKTHRDCPDDPALLQELWQLVHPTAIWRDAIIGANDGWQLVLGRADKPLLTVDSCYVAKGMAQCSRVTMLALTIGPQLPRESQLCAADGRLYRSVVADYLGSHGVELLADAFCSYLQQQALPRGLYATLRYSPGYGDWSLSAQPEVFAFLEQCRGQITLSENYLMEPVKSITAMIGWSATWQKPQYPTGEHNAFCNGGHNCAACVTWACRKGRH